MRVKSLPLAAALAATALSLPLAHAQNASPAAPSASQGAPVTPGKTTISDLQITKAANAMQKVMTLRQTYNQRIAKAKPEDRGSIAAEGHAAMEHAVTQQGLSVDQYNSILQTAQNDPTVRVKLLSRVTPPSAGTMQGAPPSGQ